MKWSVALAICLGLGACASDGAVTWARADGQRLTDGSPLDKQFQMDEAYCQGEMAKADASAGASPRRLTTDPLVYRGCMAGRGYIEQK